VERRPSPQEPCATEWKDVKGVWTGSSMCLTGKEEGGEVWDECHCRRRFVKNPEEEQTKVVGVSANMFMWVSSIGSTHVKDSAST